MLQNVLPLFLANVLGVRIWAVGVVFGVADTTASLLKLYSGWLSDRIGARKWLAVSGYAISALSKPFLYVATTWGAVAGIRFADRVGKGVRTAPRDALIADSTGARGRGFAFGLHRAGDSAGALLGILIAIAVVIGVQGDAPSLGAETFRRLVLWSLLPAFLGVVVLAVYARDVEVPPDDTPGGAPALGLRGLGRGFALFLTASVVFELGNSADAFLILRAQERGLSVVGVLWVLVGFNAVYAGVSAPAGALGDRFSRKWVVFSAWCAYAAVYFGFAVAETATHIVVLYLAYGGYHGLLAGSAKALVADLVPDRLRATAYGTYAAAVGLVSLPASVLAGVLWEGVGAWEGFGPAAPFIFGAGCAVVAALMLAMAVPASTQRALPVSD